jgi:hypothetical protein
MDKLIRESWRIYRSLENRPFVVKPSMPILFFGDSSRYFSSRLKVLTVGLNPSRIEFPTEQRFLRFGTAQMVYPRILEGVCYEGYLQALNGYFLQPPNHPYKSWFNSFEHLLTGLDCSYYGTTTNTALHTDLCSPLTTDPTWNKLPREAQIELLQSGVPLWHSLVDHLLPDVIVVSVARSHLDRISFSPQNDWTIIHTVDRDKPYNVEVRSLKITNGKTVHLVFGRAANKPFGTVSNIDKPKIGLAIKDHFYG